MRQPDAILTLGTKLGGCSAPQVRLRYVLATRKVTVTTVTPDSQLPDHDNDNRELIADALGGVPVIGKLLARMVAQRRWTLIFVLAGLFWLFVVYPLMVPWLASKLLNVGLLGSWHQPYAVEVRTAFRVEELADKVAREGNQRLDYFQVVDVTGRAANQPYSYSFSVVPGQRIRIRKEEATLHSLDPAVCPVPRDMLRREAPLFTLLAQDIELMTLNNGSLPQAVEITSAQWDALRPRMDAGRLVIHIRPVKELEVLECEALKADIRLTVEVFKDIVPSSSGAARPEGG